MTTSNSDPAALDPRIREAADVIPSALQLEWQSTEFYGFVHFGPNTFTDREWGHGHEDPRLFDPAALDAAQWVRSFKAAGMRGVILTCKHHDGFALWPSAVSGHTVASSPWRGGGGDLVAEVATACADQGMKFGVYLSPWDRSEPSYGSGTPYDDFFVAQLTELLTGYGDVFSVWFDGANGEGPDGNRQFYDWDRYYAVVRELQPGAAISVCGPDVRWCGNEAGQTRQDEWSVVPVSLRDNERIARLSQQTDDPAFAQRVLIDEPDLGSRDALLASSEPLGWYPAEVNTSIRPGWFHHPVEDSQVRSARELFEIYRRSVGGNATFLLNVPPTRDGLVADPDVNVLAELGSLIRGLDDRDIAPQAAIEFSSAAPASRSLTDRSDTAFWRPSADDPAPTITLRWDRPRRIDGLSVREQISEGQRIELIGVWGSTPGSAGPRLLASAKSVGYQRIIDFDPVEVTEIVLSIPEFRGFPTVSSVRVFEQR